MTRELLPLHPAQRDIYFDQIAHLRSPHYNTGGYIKLKGKLNKEILKLVARSVPRFFDAFQFRFDLSSGGFFVDETFSEFEIEERDFSNDTCPPKEAEKWIQDQFNKVLELGINTLPFEQALLKISETEYWFYNRYHHLITDGYGFVVWAQHVAKHYNTLCQGHPLRTNYPSYQEITQSAQSYFDSADYNQDKQYWREKFKEHPSRILNQHFGDTGRKEQSGKFSIFLSEDQREKLQALLSDSPFNLQQLTLASLMVYFAKLTPHNEFTFGVPIHKRRSRVQRNVFGTFSGIIPFQCQLNENIKFIDFLSEIKKIQRSDYRHQNYLIGDLKKDLKISESRAPFFEVVVNYENLDFRLDFGSEVKATITHVTSEFEPVPLQVCWRDFGKQQPLELQLDYRFDYFLTEEIELLAQRIWSILEQGCSNPSVLLKDITVLPEEEKNLIVSFESGKKVPYPKDKTILDLFDESVAIQPEAIAVKSGDYSLSYQELYIKSHQLAYLLQQKGVLPGTCIPFCLERSVEWIVSVIGILRVGGVYVPIASDHPEERIGHMINELQSPFVICSTSAKEKLRTVGMVLSWEEDIVPMLASLEDPIVECPSQGDDLAYLIYTSGSTGKPKGAGVTHSAIVNLQQWYIDEFKIQPSDRNIIVSSIGFDLTQKNIFGTLIAGGTIVIPQFRYFDVAEIVRNISKEKVTIINCSPSAFYAIVNESVYFSALQSLRLAILGGEPIEMPRLIAWIRHTAYCCEVINSYGPTECTDISSICRVKDPEQYLGMPIPIGKPINNVNLYVLNADSLQQQPINIPGEIFIGGDSVGVGYLNDDALTQQKFFDNPFAAGKLYRTGDLGKWLPDGNLEFLGRRDEQVKIRGQRLEIGEIRTILLQCAMVKEVAVIPSSHPDGNTCLVAYIVASSDYNEDLIVGHLKTKLPDYMIPTAFVEMDRLPLTPHGKVDTKGLPPPVFRVKESRISPRNRTEERLLQIWSEVLGISQEDISMTDSFFQLGGHSLLAVNLMSRISQEFSVDLQISILFEHPEIGLLAAKLVSENQGITGTVLVPLVENSDKPIIYCVPGVGGSIMSFAELSQHLGQYFQIYSFHAPGLDGKTEPLKSVEETAALYAQEIIKHNSNRPFILAGYSFGASIATEMCYQLIREGYEPDKLIIFDAYEPSRLIGYLPLADLEIDNEENLWRVAEFYASQFGKVLELDQELLRNKAAEEQLEILHRALTAVGIELTVNQLRGFVSVCIAHIFSHYIPQYEHKLTLPILLFKPEERVELENSWNPGKNMEDDCMDWDNISDMPIKLFNVPGRHLSFLREPYIAEVASTLRKELMPVEIEEDFRVTVEKREAL